MATILLHRHEVEEEALPFVCLRCGRPASLWKSKRFILAAPHGAAHVDKLTLIEVPLCAAHKGHWLWRGLFIGGLGFVLVACFLAGLFAVSEPDQVSEAWRTPLMIAFGVGFFGLILWLPLTLLLHFTSMRPVKITDDDITLAGVSPEFVEKLTEFRGPPSGERKGGRRRKARGGEG